MDVINSLLRAARAGNLKRVLEFIDDELVDINAGNQNGLTALHSASKEGHTQIVRELVSRGANVHARTLKGNTALHIASLAGHEPVVRVLIENGANVDVQSGSGFTALYMAAQENHESIVRLLLDNGANQNIATTDGFTPLAVAMQQGHEKIASILLNNEAQGRIRFPVTTESGRSLLHIAAKKDDCAAAALLMQNNISPDTTSKSGFTALHVACHYGNVNVARLLIDHQADVNFKAKHNITPLHVASKWGKDDLVNLLLTRNAKIDSTTRDGLTPLHCAARSGNDGVVEQLIQHGAPLSAKTRSGLAPLHMASQGDHFDAAQMLINYRAPVDDVTTDYLTALHVASHCGHVKVAKLLLNNGADPNFRALNGFTSLHIACKKNRFEIVKLLMKGASLNAVTESGLTPLHVAAFVGAVDIVIYLLENGANIESVTVRGETPLHLAARANQIEVVKVLLDFGANVGAKAKESQTPLHMAARLGNSQIAQLLLDQGFDVDAPTNDSYTALHIASKEGHENVVCVLLDNGANITCATQNHGFTPLHLASKYGVETVVDILLRYGAPVDAKGKNAVTPLHVATHYGHTNVVQLLLTQRSQNQAGANPHAMAKNGYTALHIAAMDNRLDIAETLLRSQANPNAESKAGFCPLHLAAQEGLAEMSGLLLASGAKVNARAKNGITPLHLCAQEDNVNVAQLLVKRGAHLDPKTMNGFTPLHVASHFARLNMIQFLLANGADVDSAAASGHTPLHQASQQGNPQIVDLLLEYDARPDTLTDNGQTALAIAQNLGHVSIIDKLKIVTETVIKTTTMTITEEKFKIVAPETMHETFISDSEDEADDQAHADSVKFLTTDVMKDHFNQTMTDDYHTLAASAAPRQHQLQQQDEPQQQHLLHPNQLSLGAQSVSRQQLERDEMSQDLRDLNHEAPLDGGESTFGAPSYSHLAGSYSGNQRGLLTSEERELDDRSLSQLRPDNVELVQKKPLKQGGFLVSFLVDARGGAMRGCRHSGVRVIIPPSSVQQPMRITCRFLRRERLVHPPPLMEGEACASRIMEVGPAGAQFLGPVLIEVPHFASLRNKEREITILRSDTGQVWREHLPDQHGQADERLISAILESSTMPLDYETGNETDNEYADSSLIGNAADNKENNNQNEADSPSRLTRIVTDEFPKYFAIISRIRQQVAAVGPEGSTVSSHQVPKVQAIFTEGALTKRIKIGLQNQTNNNEAPEENNNNQEPQQRAQSPLSTHSASQKRRSKFLACFGNSQQSLNQEALQVDATDPIEQDQLGELKGRKVSNGSPVSARLLRRPSQLVPEDYYAEPELPLILNMEPKTFGKRMASSAAQTEGTSKKNLSTSARPRRKRGGLCARRQKSQMTIQFEDPSLAQMQTKTTAPTAAAELASDSGGGSAENSLELAADRPGAVGEKQLLSKRQLRQQTEEASKWRSLPIQTDSDSVTINYVLVAQDPTGLEANSGTKNAAVQSGSEPSPQAEAGKQAGTAAPVGAAGDDGYVSGSGGSLNKSDSKRLLKERERHERKRAKEAKRRQRDLDEQAAKADKNKLKEEKAKRKLEQKSKSKGSSGGKIVAGEPTRQQEPSVSQLDGRDLVRVSLSADHPSSIIEPPVEDDGQANTSEPLAGQAAVASPESKEKEESSPKQEDSIELVAERLVSEATDEAIRASYEQLKASTSGRPSKDNADKLSKAKEAKDAKKAKKREKKDKKKEKKQGQKEAGKLSESSSSSSTSSSDCKSGKTEHKTETKTKKSKNKSKNKDKSEAKPSIWSRLFSRKPKSPADEHQKHQPASDHGLAQVQEKQPAQQLVISEMYPKDPNDSASEMILEVNVPKSLLKADQSSEAPIELALTEQHQDPAGKTDDLDSRLSEGSLVGAGLLSEGEQTTAPSMPIEEIAPKSIERFDATAVGADGEQESPSSELQDLDTLHLNQTMTTTVTEPLDEDPTTENLLSESQVSQMPTMEEPPVEQQQARDQVDAAAETKLPSSSADSSKSEAKQLAARLQAEKAAKRLEAENKKRAKEEAKQEKKRLEKEQKEREKEEKRLKKEQKKLAKKESTPAAEGAQAKEEPSSKSVSVSVTGASSSCAPTAPLESPEAAKPVADDYAGMVPVNEQLETKTYVEETIDDDGIVTKVTKTIETKSITLRQEETETNSRELNASDYQRELEQASSSKQQQDEVEHELPADIVELCNIPSCFESLEATRSQTEADASLKPKHRASMIKKELKKGAKLNEKLIKRALGLAKNQSKCAEREAKSAKREIEASQAAAAKALKEAKRAKSEAKRAEKVAREQHKQMDKVDKKIAKRQKDIEKKQSKLDKKAAKLAKKAEKKREKQAKKDQQEQKKAAKLERKSSQKSKKSIKLEDIGEPKLRTSSRLSLGQPQPGASSDSGELAAARVAAVATSAAAAAALGVASTSNDDNLSERNNSPALSEEIVHVSIDDVNQLQAGAPADIAERQEQIDDSDQLEPTSLAYQAYESHQAEIEAERLDLVNSPDSFDDENSFDEHPERSFEHQLDSIAEQPVEAPLETMDDVQTEQQVYQETQEGDQSAIDGSAAALELVQGSDQQRDELSSLGQRIQQQHPAESSESFDQDGDWKA